ncbi:uncharacterized protein LOC116258447 isoform X1 [Nymphaea colorata]|nr:uncharacterized protein LOC116258447 isoform X1 [Nymphaea colorata]
MRISCYGNIPFLIDLKQEPLKPPVLIPLPLRDKCFGNEFGREIRLESSLRTAQKGRSLMSIFNMNDKQIRIPNQVDFPKSHKQFNGSAGSCFRSIQGRLLLGAVKIGRVIPESRTHRVVAIQRLGKGHHLLCWVTPVVSPLPGALRSEASVFAGDRDRSSTISDHHLQLLLFLDLLLCSTLSR